MKNIIEGLYYEIECIEKDMRLISNRIKNEKNEDLKKDMIETKQAMYKRLLIAEEKLDEAEEYDEPKL